MKDHKETYIRLEALNNYLCHFLNIVENSGIKDDYSDGEAYAINRIFNKINNWEGEQIRL